jgi:hypothetical protein
MNRYLFF